MDRIITNLTAGSDSMESRDLVVTQGEQTAAAAMAETSFHDNGPDLGYIFDEPLTRAVFLVLYSTVFFFCFFGNLTVVLVLTIHWRMRTITKFCLGNLAFANLCVGVFCIFQNLSTYLMDDWIFGNLLCKMYHFTNSLSHTASVFILVLISIERYLVILHPFRGRQLLTMLRLKVLVLAIWLTSALLCAPRLYYIETIENPLPGGEDGKRNYEVICVILSSLYDSRVVDMIQINLLFLLPISMMTVLYTRIGLHLRARKKLIAQVGADRATASVRRRRGSSSAMTPETEPPGDFPRSSSRAGGRGAAASSSSARRIIRRLSQIKFSNLPNNNNNDARLGGLRMSFSSLGPGMNAGVVRLLAGNVVAFAVCNLPFHLRKLYQCIWPQADFDERFTDYATPLTFLMTYVYCAINPILFAFMSKGFRRSLVEVVKCQMRGRPSLLGGSAV